MGKQMGKVHTLNVPPLGYERDGDVKVFPLIMQPVKGLVTTGGPPHPVVSEIWERNNFYVHHMMIPKEVKLWGFNGSVPGPTIEVTQGDGVRIRFANLTMDSHPIHIHGHTWKPYWSANRSW